MAQSNTLFSSSKDPKDTTQSLYKIVMRQVNKYGNYNYYKILSLAYRILSKPEDAD